MPKSCLCAAWPQRSGEGGGREARSPGPPSAFGYGAIFARAVRTCEEPLSVSVQENSNSL